MSNSLWKPFVDVFSSPKHNIADPQEPSVQSLTEGNRCLACWQQFGFTPHKTSSDEEKRDVLHCAPCHYLKGPFSHESGQTIDNSSILLQKLASLLSDADLSDITLIVGDKTYYAHKLVLSSSSEVFKIMLTNESWADHGKGSIVLQEEEECMAVFDDFLRYLYTAVIHLSHDSVLPVLMLADKYNVLDLQLLCKDYMHSHLVSTVGHNQVITWYQYALLCHHTKVAERCERFIMWNFRKVASTRHFYDMELSVFEHFLKSSDLVIVDEYTLFQILRKWLRHSSQELVEMDIPMEELDLSVRVDNQDALKLLSYIRFPMMPPKDLIQLQQDPLAMQFSAFFITQIELAMKLHYSAEWERKMHLKADQDYVIRPRCYTNETWSTSLVIENFSVLPQHNVQPLVFSSPVSGCQADENRVWEWHLDVYPKGIEFQKCIMINLWRNIEVAGASADVVRMVLKTKQLRKCRVEVAVLIMGVQDCVEYVKRVFSRRCFFDHKDLAYNLDDIVPFKDLNQTSDSPFLVGNNGDTLKLGIIIKPV